MMKAVRGSCPVPGCRLRPDLRQAARSHSRQGTWAAAGRRSLNDAPRLKQALENLRETVQKPRFNRELAQSKVDVVAAEAAVAVAQWDAALAVAQRDAALAAARRAAANAAADAAVEMQARTRCRCAALWPEVEE